MMRYILIGMTALVAVAVGALSYQWVQGNTPKAIAFGAPFELIDQNGATITEQALIGKPSAVFFGFTHCPEVCPTTLFELSGWMDQLGDDAEKLGAFFVTVDPERDTPELVKTYVSNFSDRITGISGDPEKVMKMVNSFRIYAKKVPLDNGDYTMDHSASIMLLNSKGDFFGTIAYEENPDTALAKLRRLINEG